MKVNTAVPVILLTTAAVTGVVAQTPQPTTGSQQPAPPPAAPVSTPIAAELAQRIADAATAKDAKSAFRAPWPWSSRPATSSTSSK